MAHRFTHRNLPQQFLKAREALMAHFRPILNHYGLTEQQWRILRARCPLALKRHDNLLTGRSQQQIREVDN